MADRDAEVLLAKSSSPSLCTLATFSRRLLEAVDDAGHISSLKVRHAINKPVATAPACGLDLVYFSVIAAYDLVAIANEKEEGCDDVEWPQNTVTRLRKELKGHLQGDDRCVVAGVVFNPARGIGQLRVEYHASADDGAEEQLQESPREYRPLQGAMGGTAKYEEIVGQFIVEYEKAINKMEAELEPNRSRRS
ncbi:hypothetical protein CONPUDRAFT_156957 [Coniophora puteana RWD-64-598 SS2]|uniref:Uncharacterized protein n=1 Tax=Coniophora puteana (strain RWD-64-598) TaxID=741705 RepID=A0A5M3MGN3_CONPW|nr:uncharacterized protein CONPUDRAFT_156957 [Coniophora puteana RWD-64-598 SS2]EIW77771.1 hypothetical protein CONPUDRAFT_156957 [Coniophora puteana RWD-64-598 SS2]